MTYYGPVTTHAMHWLHAQTMLQRLYAYQRAIEMGQNAARTTQEQRELFLNARTQQRVVIGIAASMMLLRPAANDEAEAPCLA